MATGGGLAVVDWTSPGQPEVLVQTTVPGVAVWDVKVEDDLLAISSQGENERGDGGDPAAIGTHFYDGSDPTDPTLLSEWRVEDAHSELDEPTNFVHDVYVQDDLAYLAYWDAGCRVLDVSDPADPSEVSSFGVAPDADEPVEFPSSEWVQRAFLRPGNAHYVQPSPDGNHVYVGAETFPGAILDNPGTEDYGGITVFDTSDPSDPRQVTRISAPDGSGFRTSHSFDVTANRLHSSWYGGGVRIFDVTAPAAPDELSVYRTGETSFWTAVRARGFTVASDVGGGLLFLHDDSGRTRPPAFDGERAGGRGPGPERHARPE